jgi:hypothetical protein
MLDKDDCNRYLVYLLSTLNVIHSLNRCTYGSVVTVQGKGKGKVLPRTGHEGPEGE